MNESTLKMPAFCQAMLSAVPPKVLTWSMPSDVTPHTTGFLVMQHIYEKYVLVSGYIGGSVELESGTSNLMILVES